MSEPKIMNLYPVNDVYAVYKEDDGGYYAYKVPFLALCDDGTIIPLRYSYELSSCCDASNFHAYGTKESLEAEFEKVAKINFHEGGKKPVRKYVDDFQINIRCCPVCGCVVEGTQKANYCPDCGQKINWKETQ